MFLKAISSNRFGFYYVFLYKYLDLYMHFRICISAYASLHTRLEGEDLTVYQSKREKDCFLSSARTASTRKSVN